MHTGSVALVTTRADILCCFQIYFLLASLQNGFLGSLENWLLASLTNERHLQKTGGQNGEANVFLSLSYSRRHFSDKSFHVFHDSSFWLQSPLSINSVPPSQSLLWFWLLPNGCSFWAVVTPPPPRVYPGLCVPATPTVENLWIVSLVCLPSSSFAW